MSDQHTATGVVGTGVLATDATGTLVVRRVLVRVVSGDAESGKNLRFNLENQEM